LLECYLCTWLCSFLFIKKFIFEMVKTSLNIHASLKVIGRARARIYQHQYIYLLFLLILIIMSKIANINFIHWGILPIILHNYFDNLCCNVVVSCYCFLFWFHKKYVIYVWIMTPTELATSFFYNLSIFPRQYPVIKQQLIHHSQYLAGLSQSHL